MKCQDLGWNRHFQVQHVSKSAEGITDLPSVFLPSKKPTEKPCRLQSCFPFLELRPSGSNTSTRVRQHRSDMVRHGQTTSSRVRQEAVDSPNAPKNANTSVCVVMRCLWSVSLAQSWAKGPSCAGTRRRSVSCLGTETCGTRTVGYHGCLPLKTERFIR